MAKSQFRPAVSAFLLMVTMSLLSTALSFFVVPVCSDLGFGRGSFTLYYSLMVAAGAVSASFLGTYMNQHGVRGVILVSGIWCGLGFLGLSVSSHLWMFYLLGAAMGLWLFPAAPLPPSPHLPPGAWFTTSPAAICLR